jgi:ribonuclease H / adenosylcobalamin/alpha-ribazole phosphatase
MAGDLSLGSGSPVTSVVTIRHGATEFARQQRIAGRLDVRLSPEGIETARRLRPILSAVEYDAVISSPLSRAFDTARLSTGLGDDEIFVYPGCVERDYGRMQGLTPDEVAAVRPPIRYVKVGRYRHSLNPPSGESFGETRRRAASFLEDVLRDHRHGSVLIFSHQTFLQQLHGVLFGMDEFECLSLDIGHLEVNHFMLDATDRLVAHENQRWLADADGSW